MYELEEKLERIEKKLEEIYSLVKRGSDMSHANLMTIVKDFKEYNAPFYKCDKREKLKRNRKHY